MSNPTDPLEEVRQMRLAQLRACALQQAQNIRQLHEQADKLAAAPGPDGNADTPPDRKETMTDIVNVTLDARGLFCPEPVMMLHNQIRDMQIGEVVEVLATDPSTKRDFLKFCNFLDQELLASDEQDGVLRFLIRKASEAG
ncbi:sulfurtransferase TusA [Venatoribacter cucullus]|uniref:sulfurtransferase TusA n=1 Tax=Venatoribacter cucullus TaxID=2661630 RepID=UPI0030BA02E7